MIALVQSDNTNPFDGRLSVAPTSTPTAPPTSSVGPPTTTGCTKSNNTETEADDANPSVAGGSQGCKCIDASDQFASLTKNHACIMNDGETKGVRTALGGPCVPPTYGSHQCLRHDQCHDPKCWPIDPAPPAYCFRPWCFVDRKSCSKNSSELIFRSGFFPGDSGTDLFYSYSTCNSTANDWLDQELYTAVLGGVSIEAVVPTYVFPFLYKRDPNTNEVLYSTGDEYYDDTVPFEGVYIDFVKDIVELSRGDIRDVSFTHQSRASKLAHPESSFTASMQDIRNGLVGMAVGPYWITSERLKITAFTTPVDDYDMVLVTPRPYTDGSLKYLMSKVMQPFTKNLWYSIILTIVLSALLNVWFSDERYDCKIGKGKPGKKKQQRPYFDNHVDGAADANIASLKKRKKLRRAAVYARLLLDSFLRDAMFFCGGGVEQDPGSSLPKKLLMFGFAFFILVTNSAYVANLAAFLTMSQLTGSVNSMEGAIGRGLKICAHSALKEELERKWPEAEFIFSEHDLPDYHGEVRDYDAKKCDILAAGRSETKPDEALMKMYCDRDLVFTDVLVLSTPLAFPIDSSLTAGFSYWMAEAQKSYGISIRNEKEKHPFDVACDSLEIEAVEGSDYTQIKSEYMFLPFTFSVALYAAAIILQIVKSKKEDGMNNASLMSRTSKLNAWINKSVRSSWRKDASPRSNGVLHDPERRMTADEGNSTDLQTNENSPDMFTKNNDIVSPFRAEKLCVSFAVDCAPSSSGKSRFKQLSRSKPNFNEKMFHAMDSGLPATENDSPSMETEMEERFRRLAQHGSVLDEFVELMLDIKREKTS